MVCKSNGGQVPREERRTARRYTLILRAGKLVCEAGEFLCVLRDVSAKGIRARLFHPLPSSKAFTVELGSGERFALTAVWQRGRDAGFRFAAGPIDVDALLAEAGPFPKRHIRLRLTCELNATLKTADGDIAARVVDISQHGAQVELPNALPIGLDLLFSANGFPNLRARVRWRQRGRHGLVFQQGFRLDELATLAGAVQLPPRSALLVSNA